MASSNEAEKVSVQINWILKMILILRALIGTFLFVFITALCGLTSICYHFFSSGNKVDNFVVGLWARSACFLFGVKIKIKNPDLFPKVGCLVLFNHSSFFDIFALTSLYPQLRYGAKIELFKIPIFGMAMRKAGTLPIARGSREEVFKVYDEAKERFKLNEQFALSAEGGRYFGENLSKFKSGPFIFAISAQAPLLPVIIKGAHDVLPISGFLPNVNEWSRTIELEFLPLIETLPYSLEQRHQLIDRVYDLMNQKWIDANK